MSFLIYIIDNVQALKNTIKLKKIHAEVEAAL